jgi:murein tripeptide amidase MpaA
MPNKQPVWLALFVLWCLTAFSPALLMADEDIYLDSESLLPPLIEWSGKSETLVVASDDPWITPSELSGLTRTPSYDETMVWLNRLVSAAPQLSLISIGKSHQGRDFWMVVASAEGHSSAAALSASGKPLLLAQAGIHSGEIDGKDAGLMLLRDMTVSGKRRELLKDVNLLFVPIFNVDGHEWSGPYNRVNQRGPENMGWRTNARNQNFNRDYAKLDTPGVRAIVEVINEWQPDLYIDLHVTDGVDYQYDITFGGNGKGGWSPATGKWINEKYGPSIAAKLEEFGHIPGPLIMAVNGMDMQDGYYVWQGDPRYSNGYGDARHLATILVENHSLKPYRQRVLGTYVLLLASMELLAEEHASLKMAHQTDRSRRPASVDLGFLPGDTILSEEVFKGIASERIESEISGGQAVQWKGQADNRPVKQVMINQSAAKVVVPEAYLIPAEWADVADRIAAHGVPVQVLSEPLSTEAEIYHLPDAAIAPPSGWTPNPFEGRIRIAPGEPSVTKTTVTRTAVHRLILPMGFFPRTVYPD